MDCEIKIFLIAMSLALRVFTLEAQIVKNEVDKHQNTLPSDEYQKNSKISKINFSHPKKALIASMTLPGMGQIINKQAWKTPIALGAIGGATYLFYNNQKIVSSLKTAINQRFLEPTEIDEFSGIYTDSQLFSLENEYTRLRDYSFLGILAVYLLQSLDAYAAGFLVDFDVSPTLNLSTSYSPLPLAPIGGKIILSWP